MEALGEGLEGKGVIVTGAAGGIGRAVAQGFARAGARLLVTDISQEGVDRVLGSLSGAGHEGFVCDLRDTTAGETLVSRAIEKFGSLRALAQVAAISLRRATPVDVSEKDWDDQLDINLRSTFFLARAACEAMKKAGDGGSIVGLASQAWWTGGFGGSMVYAASKGGMVSVCRGLARTYGPDGITVNTVAPGLVDTEMIADMDKKLVENMLQATPVRRLATPEDIAGIVVFLASDHARYITGATVNLSGGFLMY